MFSAECIPTDVYLSTPKARIARKPLLEKVLPISRSVFTGPIFSRAGGILKYLIRCSVPKLDSRIAPSISAAPTMAKVS